MPEDNLPEDLTHSWLENCGGQLGITRILDAAANRASEGLRIIEDYVRFALDDRHLTEQLKTLRHELMTALAGVEVRERLVARESLADVGTDLKTDTELTRTNLEAVLKANFRRLQQALRSLEEFLKLSDSAAAQKIEQLRYQAYTLEKAVQGTRRSIVQLSSARLYVLVDGQRNESDFRQLCETLVAAGIHVLQLREKHLDDRTLLSRARLMREITRGTETLFIMNDRPDLAVLSDADGVHVGQEELSVKDVRTIVGSRQLVGVSTHSLPQARAAVLAGADYIGVGPTFPSDTKHFGYFPGVDLVDAVAREITLPAFAIGGITLENLPALQAVGCSRVAVAAAICAADNPAQVVEAFLSALSPRSDLNSDSISTSVPEA